MAVVLAVTQEATVHAAPVFAVEPRRGAHQGIGAVLLVTPVRAVVEAVAAESADDAVDSISAGEKCGGALRLHFGAALLVALVEAVRQPVALPPPRDALPVSTHEIPRDVALGGEVIPREQLAVDRAGARARSKQ